MVKASSPYKYSEGNCSYNNYAASYSQLIPGHRVFLGKLAIIR
jgi:hypothetical protein